MVVGERPREIPLRPRSSFGRSIGSSFLSIHDGIASNHEDVVFPSIGIFLQISMGGIDVLRWFRWFPSSTGTVRTGRFVSHGFVSFSHVPRHT